MRMKQTEEAAVVRIPARAPAYEKSELLRSARWANRRDALTVLLKDGEKYTHERVASLLDDYLKGKVNGHGTWRRRLDDPE